MIQKLSIEYEDVAKKVLQVQIPAYQVEAELINFDEIPPLKDTVRSLQKCGETFYGYFIGEELAGAVSYTRDGDILDIHRMIVHPSHFRKGIANKLLHHIENIESAAVKIVVSTGSKNKPAKSLYTTNGFHELKEIEVAPGVNLTLFEKLMQKTPYGMLGSSTVSDKYREI